MKNWAYDELFDAIKELYDDMLSEDRGYRYAVAKTFYEFETVCNEGRIENLIVHTAMGEIVISHERVFIGNIEAIKKHLSSFSSEELTNELTEEELKGLSQRIKTVLTALDTVELDYDHNAEKKS